MPRYDDGAALAPSSAVGWTFFPLCHSQSFVNCKFTTTERECVTPSHQKTSWGNPLDS